MGDFGSLVSRNLNTAYFLTPTAADEASLDNAIETRILDA
jgi:hypothetical protein